MSCNEKCKHTKRKCTDCGHPVAHHSFNYRYCGECVEQDAKYNDGSFCDRKANTRLSSYLSKLLDSPDKRGLTFN